MLNNSSKSLTTKLQVTSNNTKNTFWNSS